MRPRVWLPLVILGLLVGTLVACGDTPTPPAPTSKPGATTKALATSPPTPTIRIGSKNFTEQLVLGEMYALYLESIGFRVDRNLNLGGTIVAHDALKAGSIDLYPEYTGTGLLAILKL